MSGEWNKSSIIETAERRGSEEDSKQQQYFKKF